MKSEQNILTEIDHETDSVKCWAGAVAMGQALTLLTEMTGDDDHFISSLFRDGRGERQR